ncbi:GGDEF domain-containing protein [Candidatus Pacearchaeota archaeon]|nr:GGDEF domain-containing protein [Candidatus Pacearchaeota archaeon]
MKKEAKAKEEMQKKLSVLDPKFKAKIEKLFESMTEYMSIIYDLAISDEKTGLHNSKFFESVFEMEFEKAKRGQSNLCLFIIDLDFFKKINDTYGHVKGDEILRIIGSVLKKHIRKSDVAARFGGEEFIILLPETNLEKAKRLAQRLKNLVANNKILKRYRVTFSGGLAQYKKGDAKKSLKDRADKALYQAKNSGRNKTIAIK